MRGQPHTVISLDRRTAFVLDGRHLRCHPRGRGRLLGHVAARRGGYIQNMQEPFRDWVLYLAVMLPMFAATGSARCGWRAGSSAARRGAPDRGAAPVLVVMRL